MKWRREKSRVIEVQKTFVFCWSIFFRQDVHPGLAELTVKLYIPLDSDVHLHTKRACTWWGWCLVLFFEVFLAAVVLFNWEVDHPIQEEDTDLSSRPLVQDNIYSRLPRMLSGSSHLVWCRLFVRKKKRFCAVFILMNQFSSLPGFAQYKLFWRIFHASSCISRASNVRLTLVIPELTAFASSAAAKACLLPDIHTKEGILLK